MKLLLCLALGLIPAIALAQVPSCPSGMIYESCGTDCPLTCENHLNPPICTRQCIQGCFCPQEMVQHNGGCVTPSDCPAPPPTPPPTPTCSNNMVYQTCGSDCPLTCENRNDPPRPCPLICRVGCGCPFGMAEYQDSCYNPDDCPSTATTTATVAITPVTLPPPPTCTNGRIYNSCGTACPLTCEFPDPRPCPKICEQGCFCPEGLLQDGDRCVARDQCPPTPPPTPPPPPTCINGMIYETCGTYCPLTCENRNDPPQPCPAVCVTGCFCRRGMAVYEGSCYEPDSCPVIAVTTVAQTVPTTVPPPPVCTNGKIYSTCGTACPLTCEHPEAQAGPCLEICAHGCFCPDGLLQHGDSCVARDQCPSNTTTPIPTRPSPTTPTCTNGMIFQNCGTTCPLTCENRDNPPLFCSFVCRVGCGCPQGMAEHQGSCYRPEDCPAIAGTTTAAPPTRPTLPTRPPPTCTNGMIYETCGTYCPLTCENRNDPPQFCQEICVTGCFCPRGMVEHQGSCYEPDNCPAIATPTSITPVPTRPTCPASMVFTSCGSTCHLTCENYANAPLPCNRRCFIGCVCPTNSVLHNGECIPPRNCPITPTTAMTVATPEPCPAGMEYRSCGPVCRPTCLGFNGCFSLRCVEGCFCPEGQMEHEGGCVEECPPTDPCQINNGGCRDDQVCELVGEYPQCRDPPYVPCGRDAFLACDSEWTYCLQQNKTRRAQCVSSCLARNGNCASDTTCVTTVEDEDRPRLQCLKQDDLPRDCPAGQVMNQCGDHCQETCEQRVAGLPVACILVCGPPACVCPRGLVLFRDRCVDPRLCYTLLKYPPAIRPLPVVDPNSVLLSLRTNSLHRGRFRDDMHRRTFLQSIEEAVGLQDVDAQLHGIFNDSQGVHIVIMLSGSDIDSSSASALASVLSQNAQMLTITIEQVVPVEVEYVTPPPEESDGLSRNAIIGIAVSSGVAGLAVVVAWIAVVLCCCVMRERNSRIPSNPPAYQPQKSENLYQLDERVVIVDPEKGKMVLESLNN